jgi:acetyl esterase/lipase
MPSRLYHLSLAFVLTLGAAALRAQTGEEFPLLALPPGSLAPAAEIVDARTTGLDDQGRNRAVSGITIPTVTVYRATSPVARRSAVVICPGGGYGRLAIDIEGHAIARFLQKNGITAAVLKYRLPQPALTGEATPLSQQDALAAIRFVRTRAKEWGIDPKRVGIMGFSAGGHLAGSTAFLGDTGAGTRPDFVALLYPVVLMEGASAHAGSRKNLLGPTPAPGRAARFSLERQVNRNSPPHFLVHALDDRGVPPQNSRALADALRAAGVPVTLAIITDGGHGFGLGRTDASRRWPAEFVTWLTQFP